MKTYIFLRHRDKKDIKLLFTCNLKNSIDRKIKIEEFNLDIDFKKKINKVQEENKMKYDLYAKSCESYKELINKLKNSGFYELSNYSNPLFDYNKINLTEKLNYIAKLI